MFDDLEISNLNSNLERYYLEFYERIVCGCSGVLVGPKAEPRNYSMLACDADQLTPFTTAFAEFLQRFPIMRNVTDKIFFRFLCRLKDLAEEQQQRLVEIIALLVQNKTYNRSKKEAFFLFEAALQPEGTVAVCKCLDEIKNKIGENEAFNFVSQYDFLTVFGRDDFDKQYFEEHMKWFMDYYHALE